MNSPKPLETPTFFLDRTLGKNIFASLLRAADLSVEIHDDHFPPDARDEEWLRKAGEKNWVVVTNDRHIRYRPIELAALKASKVRTFVFTRGNLRADEMARIFLRALPQVQGILRKNRGPFIASVSSNGDVRLML